jgi:hypothetical protein
VNASFALLDFNLRALEPHDLPLKHLAARLRSVQNGVADIISTLVEDERVERSNELTTEVSSKKRSRRVWLVTSK